MGSSGSTLIPLTKGGIVTLDHIKAQNISKLFGEVRAIDDIDITIKQGEFFTLLGPSGCGKTTLLRTIAGFYIQEEGNLFFGEDNINDLPTHKRNIGMVFQNYAIFPHMTVFENVAYGLKARKVPKEDIKTRVNEALEMVELAHLADRQPAQLSGGQQQRVALARATVIHPGVLLMDEPLSNLDAKLRIKMREDIRGLQKRLNITTVYVTHDQEEALAVSDRIAVLKDGVIQQIGKPHEIYLRPRNKFVANFIGSTNLLPGTAKTNNALNTTVMIENTQFDIPLQDKYEGNILYSIRPEQVMLEPSENEGDLSFIDGEIIESTFLGEQIVYKIRLASNRIISVHEHAISFHMIRGVGDKVKINLNPAQAVVFNESGEEALNEYKDSRVKAESI